MRVDDVVLSDFLRCDSCDVRISVPLRLPHYNRETRKVLPQFFTGAHYRVREGEPILSPEPCRGNIRPGT